MFRTPQGITTEVTGQRGTSRVPVSAEHLDEMYDYFAFTEPKEDVKRWVLFEQYLDYASKLSLSANVKFNVGHRPLRAVVMGFENRPATKKEPETGRPCFARPCRPVLPVCPPALFTCPATTPTLTRWWSWPRWSIMI